jgi:hypothetical protein
MAWIKSNLDKIAKNIKDFVLEMDPSTDGGLWLSAASDIVHCVGISIFARIFVKAAPETPSNAANAMMAELTKFLWSLSVIHPIGMRRICRS